MRNRLTSVLATIALASGALVASTTTAAHASALPELTVGDVHVAEGDAGRSTVKVSVDLSVPSATKVTVPYSVNPVADGVTDSGDAVSSKRTVSFPAGVVSKPVAVTVNGDTGVEANQHFVVALGTPVGATVSDGSGEVTIEDDDANGVDPGVTVSIGDVLVHEADAGTHLAYLPVTLSRPATVPLSVTFLMGCSSLVRVTDLTVAKSGTIKFLAGQQSKTITLRVAANVTSQDLSAVLAAIKAAVGPVAVVDGTGSAQVIDDEGGDVNSFDSPVGSREQVSVGPNCVKAQYTEPGGSLFGATSGDGRFVAFSSPAANLVPDDTNNVRDLFIRDRLSNTTERVNLKADGSQVTAADLGALAAVDLNAYSPSISPDGRYVGFVTAAPLVAADRNGSSFDAYLYDRATHTPELVSSGADGLAVGGVTSAPTMSDDGEITTFTVDGQWSPVAPGPTLYSYVHRRSSGATTLLQPGPAWNAVVSGDGRTVVVTDSSVDFHNPSLVAIDLVTNTRERIDVTTGGAGAVEGDFSQKLFTPAVSPDGRYVTFRSYAWNLIPGRTGPLAGATGAFPSALVRIYVRDRQLGTTSLLGDPNVAQDSVWQGGLSISGDGQLVAIGPWASATGILFDRGSGTQETFGLPSIAKAESVRVDGWSLSRDGRYVAYSSSTLLGVSDVIIQRVR